MLLPHMVVKGKVGSIPVQFYCLSLHIKSIEIACVISDMWAGSMYWLSSKWSEQIWYEFYNCFAVFEPRSPGLVCRTHFLDHFSPNRNIGPNYCTMLMLAIKHRHDDHSRLSSSGNIFFDVWHNLPFKKEGLLCFLEWKRL